MAADLRTGLDQSELARPRREATLPTEVGKSTQDRHHRVVRALTRKIVQVRTMKVRKHRAAAIDFEPRRAEQQGVQRGNCGVAVRTGMAQPIYPIVGRRPRIARNGIAYGAGDLLVTPQAKPAEAGRASGSVEAAAPVGSSRQTSTSVASVMTTD